MIQFKKLRISGFKSFIDRTELDIEPGLTGVVGPNGCGKSNLVEAMRWVMGESSAKRMRGGGMDDVIFAGASGRPARSFAEVSLKLDNSDKTAPPQYNNNEEIEITRKITRDHGSIYKINGRTVRAQDVQLLFADAMSGANSPAMVSQGQISRIITSKPTDRRQLLEESAGISGLYARRHEAEQRLRGADTNLIRLDDILGSMEKRLSDLKKQARQATRYRNISTQIRQIEMVIAWLEWKNLYEKTSSSSKKLGELEKTVAQRTADVVRMTTIQAQCSKELPYLRNENAKSAAKLQNLRLTLQRLEDEISRIETSLSESSSQLKQARTDRERELQTQEDGATQMQRMDQEQKSILASQSREEKDLEEKEALRQSLEEKVSTMEATHSKLTEEAAYLKASRENITSSIHRNEKQAGEIQEKINRLEETLSNKRQEIESCADCEKIQKEINNTEEKILNFKNKAQKLQVKIEDQREQTTTSREKLADAEKEKNNICTEINTVEKFVKLESDGEFRQIIEDVTVSGGFETALSKALGEALTASLDETARQVWLEPSTKENLPPLPKGSRPLSDVITTAPEILTPALSMIGIAENEEEGEKLRKQLLPGQSLVCRSGTSWRWDGLHYKDSSVDRNALRLQRKNQLQELKAKLPASEARMQNATSQYEKNKNEEENLNNNIKEIKQHTEDNEKNLYTARRNLDRATKQRASLESELYRIKNSQEHLLSEKLRLTGELEKNRENLTFIEKQGIDEKYTAIEKSKQELGSIREELTIATRECALGKQRQETRKARLHALADERLNLQNRIIRSKEWVKDLEKREETLSTKLSELKGRPEEISKDREEIIDLTAKAEKEKNEIAEKLAAREHETEKVLKELRNAERELSSVREERAALHSTREAIRQRLEETKQTITTRFELIPTALPSRIGIPQEELEKENLSALRKKFERLTKERNSIGPVNLRADTEAQELGQEVEKLTNERNDLLEAISELREGIRKLNSEARERLRTAFDTVNTHFSHLFTRLFNGGKAYLSLVGSEDPLDAGLEIFAQPPGKTLQRMTLLSGGEQALASAALIFAMFLTNPSPICVMDEIDAPLDDANVDRLCDLLDEIAETSKTRFLVITHHRLTMARMDRLYGVTMAEKGVSQLVSVDLQQNFGFMEAAE